MNLNNAMAHNQDRRFRKRYSDLKNNMDKFESDIREGIALEIECLLNDDHWKMVGCCHSCVAIRRAVEIVRGL